MDQINIHTGNCLDILPTMEAGSGTTGMVALELGRSAELMDDCIIGVVEQSGQPPCVCYDREKVISKLATDMSREEAEEWHYFNQAAGFYGESTPCFLDLHEI